MLERLSSSRQQLFTEPICPQCKVSMSGVSLIPGFAVFK
jgi:hypothetical protein